MLTNMKVTTKLFAILAAPVLVMLVLAYVNVRERRTEARKAEHVVDVAGFVGATTDLLQQVEIEGLHAARFSGSAARSTNGDGDAAILGELTAQQASTDDAYAAFRDKTSVVDAATNGQAVRDAIGDVQERFDGLEKTRQSVREQTYDGLAIAKSYGLLAEVLRDTVTKVAINLDNPKVSNRLQRVADLAALAVARGEIADRLAVAVEVGFFPEVLPKGSAQQARKLTEFAGSGVNRECAENPAAAAPDNCQIYLQILKAKAEADTVEERFADATKNDGSGDQADLRAQGDDTDFKDMVAKAVQSGKDTNDLTGIAEPVGFANASLKAIRGLGNTSDHILLAADNPTSAASIAGAEAAEAQRQVRTYLVGVLLAIGAAALISFVVGRLITPDTDTPDTPSPRETVSV